VFKDLALGSIEADALFKKAQNTWRLEPTDENFKILEDAKKIAQDKAVELQKLVWKYQPRTWSGLYRMLTQGNLLAPISHVYNLAGNMVFIPARIALRTGTAGLDTAGSVLRGTPRTAAVSPITGTAQALRGVGRGLGESFEILAKGYSSERVHTSPSMGKPVQPLVSALEAVLGPA